jgi:uncharacterized protein
MSDMERRYVDAELRAADDGGRRRLSGYAAVFDSQSEDLGGFREVIKPGAFKRVLATKPDVKALFNHDPNRVLGRTTNGTLALVEDERGLRVDITLPETATAEEVHALVRGGYVSQMSFAFSVGEAGEQWNKRLRTLTDVNLFDVSVVTDPAYRATEVSARALAAAAESDQEADGQEPDAIEVQTINQRQAQELLEMRRRRLRMLERLNMAPRGRE